MLRRQYLALSAAIVGTTAGCSSVRGERSLVSDEEIDDTSALLLFRESRTDGNDVLNVHLQKQFTDAEPREYYPFWIAATRQREDVRVSSLRLTFRSPPRVSGFSPAGIHLREDGHAEKATLYQHGDNPSTTVLDLPDIDDIGRGSVVANLLLTGDQTQDPQELWMRVEAILSTDSVTEPDYSATGDITVEFP